MEDSCCFHFNGWKENKNSPLVVNGNGIFLACLPENILMKYCIFCGVAISKQSNKKEICSKQVSCGGFNALLNNNPNYFYFADRDSCYFYKWKDLNNILYFCLFCGGELPISETKPVSEEDLTTATKILSDKNSVKEIIDLLGHPTGEIANTPYLSAEKLVLKDLWFSNFIEGCILHIQEFEDGNFDYFLYSDETPSSKLDEFATNTNKVT